MDPNNSVIKRLWCNNNNYKIKKIELEHFMQIVSIFSGQISDYSSLNSLKVLKDNHRQSRQIFEYLVMCLKSDGWVAVCLGWGFMAQSTQRGLFVCAEVLRPSQPNWVMSSAVSLPNHFYWTGLVLNAVNQYCAYSFARNWQLPFLSQQ